MTPNRIRVFAAAAALALAVSACSSQPASAPTANNGVQLVKDGALTVCTHLSYKPFEFKDSAGKIVGFDVDLMDMVAKKLGVTTELVDIDFASMQSGAVFAARKCDIAAGAITITETRQKAVQFSDPYFEATQALIAKKGSGIKDLADLNGKKLGVQTNTTGQEYAQKNASGAELVVFDDMATTLNGTLSGRVDASINDNSVIYGYVAENPTVELVKEFATGEEYGFIVQKDNANATMLNGTVNEVLKTAKTDGTYDSTYKKWFGKEPTA